MAESYQGPRAYDSYVYLLHQTDLLVLEAQGGHIKLDRYNALHCNNTRNELIKHPIQCRLRSRQRSPPPSSVYIQSDDLHFQPTCGVHSSMHCVSFLPLIHGIHTHQPSGVLSCFPLLMVECLFHYIIWGLWPHTAAMMATDFAGSRGQSL